MKFRYEAMDNTGLEVLDAIEAESREAACALVREKGFFLTNIRQVHDNFRFADQEPLTLAERVQTLRVAPKVEPQSISWNLILWIGGISVFISGFLVGLALGRIS